MTDLLPRLRASLSDWSLRALGAPAELEVGLPYRFEDSDASLAARGPGVWLTLEDALAPDRPLQLWLEAALAAAIVDRCLGGEGAATPGGHPAALLDEAELGVLAYAAARALSELGSGLRLADLGTQAPPCADAVEVPARVRLGEATCAARLRLPPTLAGQAAPPVHWQLAAETGPVDGLSAGDVLVLEHTLSGGWLRAEGVAGSLPVRRGPQGFTARPGPEPAPDSLRIEVYAGHLSWRQLADLKREDAPPVTARLEGGGAARLSSERRALWAGELVRLKGRLGFRAREQTPPQE